MKLLSLGFIVSTLFMGTALANKDLVGAYAFYEFQSPESSGTKKVELTHFNQQTNRYTQITTTILSNGETDRTEEKIPADDINTQEENEVILSLCESQLEGKREVIIVKAGSFDSCALKDDESTFYFANVPFGYIKLVSEIQRIELQSFSF
jgi:chaperonin GroEL (HSP60 family)